METKIKHLYLLLLSILSLAGFILLSSIINTNLVEIIDNGLIEFVQEIKSPLLTAIMMFFSFIGSTKIVILISLILMAILYKFFQHHKELLLFVIVLIGTWIFNTLLKALFQRERPTLYTMVEAEGFSFPSGHSMIALSLYGILAFLLWRHILRKSGRTTLIFLVVLFILTVGFSRIYLGVHFPSDIIGAYLFSSFWLFLNIWAFRNYAHHMKKSVSRQ